MSEKQISIRINIVQIQFPIMPAKVNKDLCTGCGNCTEVCPNNAIEVKEVAEVNEDECTDCGACVDECPSEAIKLED